MRVAVVCPYDLAAPGGVQQLTSELAGQLRSLGHDAVLVGAGNSAYSEGPGRDDATVPVGRPISLRGNKSVVPVTLAPTTIHLVGRVLADVDLIHLHEPFIPLVGWSSLRARKPMVATFHADPPRWAETLYRYVPGLRRRMRRAVLTAVSPAAAAAVPPPWGQIDVIPNAIDVGSYRVDVGRVGRRVAFLGRDDPRKGLDILLDSWPRIREEVPDAELVVIGAERASGPDGVSFRGRVSEPEKRRLMASAAIYAAPNTGGESFGIVIAEAMAAGCAVVASDLEPFAEVLGDAGRQVRVGSPDALANAISDLLIDTAERDRLSRAGAERVKRFDWSVVMDRYLAAYERAISRWETSA